MTFLDKLLKKDPNPSAIEQQISSIDLNKEEPVVEKIEEPVTPKKISIEEEYVEGVENFAGNTFVRHGNVVTMFAEHFSNTWFVTDEYAFPTVSLTKANFDLEEEIYTFGYDKTKCSEWIAQTRYPTSKRPTNDSGFWHSFEYRENAVAFIEKFLTIRHNFLIEILGPDYFHETKKEAKQEVISE